MLEHNFKQMQMQQQQKTLIITFSAKGVGRMHSKQNKFKSSQRKQYHYIKSLQEKGIQLY